MSVLWRAVKTILVACWWALTLADLAGPWPGPTLIAATSALILYLLAPAGPRRRARTFLVWTPLVLTVAPLALLLLLGLGSRRAIR